MLVRYLHGAAEQEVRARAAVVATPAFVAREVVRDLPQETAGALAAIRYGIYSLFPQARGLVRELVIQRWAKGLPYAAVGRARLQVPLTRPLGAIHLAGDYLGGGCGGRRPRAARPGPADRRGHSPVAKTASP